MIELEHHTVQVNGLNLHVVQAGPADGSLVVLLHGFPEFWYGWKPQIEFLAAQGYRVWAPDQRGYNLSDKPANIAEYRLDILASDVKALIEAAGKTKAVVVGHDWGAAVAWWTATKHPEVVERLVIINVPHVALLSRIAWRNPRQLVKSWYMLFFQIPRFPEFGTRLANWRVAVNSLRGTSRRGTFSDEDIAQYKAAWSQPNAMTSMLNWYRALRYQFPKIPKGFRLPMPVLILWGVKDAFLLPVGASTSTEVCQDVRLIWFPNATHWLAHEEPDAVNQHILEFIKKD